MIHMNKFFYRFNKLMEGSMKKTKSVLVLFAFLLTLVCGISFGQEVDITGTWVGETEVPDMPEPDKITLVMEKVDREYKGTVSDSMEMLLDTECEEIKLEGNELTFNFLVFTGEEYMRVYMILTVEGDMIKGYWESEDGSSASIELKKVG